MRLLVELAEWLCGESARHSVFEPLVADWQHELTAARVQGRWRHAHAIVAGSLAYANGLARSALTGGGWLPASGAAQAAVLGFWLAAEAAAGVLLVLALETGRTVDVRSVQTQALLLHLAPLISAAGVLPALFVMRRDRRSTPRHAIAAIMLGAIFTSGVVTLTTPEMITGYFTTFESFEREYQRDIANDRAGRYQYPGTVIRQMRGPSTVAQRRANFERFMAWRAEQEAKAPAAPLTWREHALRYQPVALAILFGMIGWTLAGLGAPSFTRATIWWGLMYGALLAFGGTPTMVGLPLLVRIQHGLALPFFGAIGLTLVIASWRRQAFGTTHDGPDFNP